MPAKSESEIRVRFSETDPAGIVHFGRYLDYIDVGRNDFYRKYQGRPRRPGDEGVSTVLVQTIVDYKTPARFDEILIIETSLEFVKNTSFGFSFIISKKDSNVIVCHAKASHVCLDVETYKPISVPEAIRKLFDLP